MREKKSLWASRPRDGFIEVLSEKGKQKQSLDLTDTWLFTHTSAFCISILIYERITHSHPKEDRMCDSKAAEKVNTENFGFGRYFWSSVCIPGKMQSI